MQRALAINSKRGFSLVELMIAVSVLILVSGFTLTLVGPALRARDVEMAVRTASLEMRRGRQIALDSRRKCRVIFTAPRTVRIESQAPASQGGGWSQLSEVELPGDIEFRIESAVGWGPESYPTSQAINFGTSGYSEVYFMPDGAAIGADGQNCNGVVYMCRAGDVETVRAVTLFGSTGRLKRWEWAYDGSSWDWEQ